MRFCARALAALGSGCADGLCAQGCIKPLCDLLTVADARLITVALEGIENILKAGEQEVQNNPNVFPQNPYTQVGAHPHPAAGLSTEPGLSTAPDSAQPQQCMEPRPSPRPGPCATPTGALAHGPRAHSTWTRRRAWTNSRPCRTSPKTDLVVQVADVFQTD